MILERAHFARADKQEFDVFVGEATMMTLAGVTNLRRWRRPVSS